MVIRDLSKHMETTFRCLLTGDVFRFDDRLLMKVGNVDDTGNAYDFSRGFLTDIEADTKVAYVPSELVLHEKGWTPS